MDWIDRLSDKVPDISETAGGLAILAGSVVAIAGVLLASPAGGFAGVLLIGGGRIGPALSDLKHAQHEANAGTLPLEKAVEYAVFDMGPAAIERDREAQRQWRAMVASQERPPC